MKAGTGYAAVRLLHRALPDSSARLSSCRMEPLEGAVSWTDNGLRYPRSAREGIPKPLGRCKRHVAAFRTPWNSGEASGAGSLAVQRRQSEAGTEYAATVNRLTH
jgi:hypothetical protein